MAKKQGSGDDILLNINVTGREELAGARQDAKGLKQELEQVEDVDLDKPVKTLKSQLREATLETQKLFAAGKQNTQEYRNSVKRVAELKDNIEELNRTFEAFNPDNKFRVFSQVASAGANIVQGYAGAMAFLGVNSEDAAATIAKLQGIMAFTDAIGSLADLQDSYKDLKQLLGLTTVATQAQVAVENEAAAAALFTADEQVAAAARVEAAEAQLAALTVASEEAMVAARAESLTMVEGLTVAEENYLTVSSQRAAATVELAAAQEALAVGTGAATAATMEQAGAMEVVTVAEEAATVGATGFGTALKLIGIGLIISAIAYLITNFEKVKKVVTDLFPSLGKTGELFNKVKEIAFGVGNVILQYLITPIKILIDVLKGDFAGAMQDLKDGFNVVGNYEKGAAYERGQIAEQERIDKIKKEIETNERLIKERKALGQNTTALEIKNQKLKIAVLEKDDADYAKNRADLMTELTVIQNTEWKRQNDLYKAKLKADLDALKANYLEAQRVVRSNSDNQRKVELTDLDIKYQKEFALLKKRKADLKDYNAQYNTLVAARKAEEQKVNKKYDDAIIAYTTENYQAYFNEFERKEVEIKKRAEELLKNATPKQAAEVKQSEAFALNRNTALSIATGASQEAETNLTNTTTDNRPKASDTPDEARAKIANLEAARLSAEQAAYELKKVQLAGQYNELEQLDADHQKNVTDVEQEAADARRDIAEAEAAAKLKLWDAIGQGATAASELVGESTIAGKALAVAAATISTYTAIAGQLAAFSGVPIPGYAIIQAVATGIFGLLQVKKILQVKVPAKGGSGSGGGGGAAAPVINSTVLSQNSSGSNQVANAVNQGNANKSPLKAYITNKDLGDQQKKADYHNAQSQY